MPKHTNEMQATEKRLSNPVTREEQYQWAILQELRALRKLLETTSKDVGDVVQLRERANYIPPASARKR